MGTYIYSTRKPTKEILIAGITPVTVFTIEYAYKPLHTWKGDRGHAANMRMQGRVASQSLAAKHHHIEQGHNIVVWGGFEEGNPVYRIEDGLIPSTVNDRGDFGARCGTEYIGTLYKVAGRWTIEQNCPGHNWNYKVTKGNDAAKMCMRCGRTEYVDADKQAAFVAEYPEAA
jgi:hypothetical protein